MGFVDPLTQTTVIPLPVEIQVDVVPHLKGLINSIFGDLWS